MSINKEQLREKFKGLSTRYGGSLLTKPQLLDQKSVVLFFGLGGLGCRAVNAIKSSANEKLNNPDRRFYRAIDTCLTDMGKIAEATTADIEDPNQVGRLHGCIAADEMIALYDKAHPFTVADLDSSVNAWLDRSVFDRVRVDERGAQSIRQIGRVMLLGNYNRVYSEVSTVIAQAFTKAQANHTSVKIYIIAGISGGTGSGSIIDFSYMVRKVLKPLQNIQHSVEGILFTPDVQEKDESMTQEAYNGIKRNFYAAIKEIDYFYNNVARKKAYSCPTGEDSDAYKEDIFDECTLISRMASGAEIAANSDVVVGKLAEALTYEMSGIVITARNGSAQSYEAYYSNVNAYISAWRSTPAGQGMNLPDWAPTRYSSLGYSSFYVPRDELFSYCANRLMERLIEQWNGRNITEDEITRVMRKSSLDSNRSFARKIFQMANCGELFELERSALPKDGLGLLPVKNCASYLDAVREIAGSESRQNYIAKFLGVAERARVESFVKPILSEIDKAFAEYSKGPVYAINLLSSGIDQNTQFLYTNSGVLVRIRKMIAGLSAEAENWKLELDQMYSVLQEKAGRLDGKISAEASDLETFTNDSRQYAEDLLKVAILKEAGGYLASIYSDLNDKNNRVFEVYATTFEFLLATLKKDSQYVTDSERKREGHTTIFSFDVADFKEDDPKSRRFKEFFDQVVDGKSLDEESRGFVEQIFGELKEKFDPVNVDGKTTQQATEDDIVDIIRTYFNNRFSDWADGIIEKFCVIAYSSVDVSPQLLTQVWENPALKNAALQAAAQDIETTVSRDSAVMLTSEDSARSIENYTSYMSFAALENTTALNNFFANRNSNSQSNWPEFIRFKRVFGIPLSFIDGLKEYKKLYDESTVPGLHLDEVGDNWRHTLPEPFSYNVSKFLGLYRGDGNDVTETDRLHMLSILNMAQEAKKLGVLKSRDEKTVPSYDLYYKFLRQIDFSSEKQSMYEKFRTAILRDIEEGVESDFVSILTKTGYALDVPVSIEWTFARPEYNVMENKTDFGNDIVFGNFITLIRSCQEWEEKLKESTDTFGSVFALYESAKTDLKVADRFEVGLKEFARAICVEMVKEHTNQKTGRFAGYKLQYGARKEDAILIDNTGWDFFDKQYILYLFFVEKFLELNEGEHAAFMAYLDKYEGQGVAEGSDVTQIYKQISEVLTDPEYLGQYAQTLRDAAFKKVIGDSRHLYEVPAPSNNNKNTSVVVKNLQDFYSYLRNYLEKNGNI